MIQYYDREAGKLTEIAELKSTCWIVVVPPFSPNELQELSQVIDIPLDFNRLS